MPNQGYAANSGFGPGFGPASGRGKGFFPGPGEGPNTTDPMAVLNRIATATEVIAEKYGMPDWAFARQNTIPAAPSATIGALSELFDSNINPVCIITLQCFAGSFDVFFGDGTVDTIATLPVFRIAAGGPVTIPYNGSPLKLRLRNNSTTVPAQYSVLMTTTAG